MSAQTIGHAADFVDEYCKPMALRVYGDAAVSQCERNAAVVARHILSSRLSAFNARALRREAGYPGPKKPGDLDAALAHLVDTDLIRPAPEREGGTPGRMSANYAVNPKALSDG